ncbi:TlpA family protein disulfide reductase [Dermabacteraceae bacterium TAE3-ERU27]|nr:TlpA family protein disulfide reductase [Dermabacteraceae bacterium TAE3-ERU27]
MTRKLNRRHLLSLTALLALTGCREDASNRYGSAGKGYVAGEGIAQEIAPAERGEPISFSGTTVSGEKFSSSSLAGKIMVVNVWYAACAPCRSEAPLLQETSVTYAPKGVSFVGVNVRDAAGPARAFEERFGITYPSLLDEAGSITHSLRGAIPPNAVPTTIITDRQHRPAARISGAADPSILRAMIDRVVSE